MAQTIGGRYEVEAALGRGAFGAVYLALDPRLRRRVAVKVLNAAVSGDPAVRARFTREARVMASLDHSAIVPVFDFGEEDGEFFLVLRHCAGGTLGEALARRMEDGRGPFSPAEALALLGPVGGALDAAHARGVVHRDLKPGNILLDEHGQPAVADFGLVRLLAKGDAEESLSVSGVALGSPLYMAPEQWEGDKGRVSGRTDLYALGCIAFQLLVGRAPFAAASAPALMIQHLEAPAPRLADARPGLPAAWDAAVARLLAKDPAERFATAGDFLRGLQAAGPGSAALPAVVPDDRPLASPPTLLPPPAESARPARGVPLWAWAVGGALCGAAILTLILRGGNDPGRGTPTVPTPSPLVAPTASPAIPRAASADPLAATREQPHEIPGLGMRFVPVPIASGQVLFSVTETRVRDYAAFVAETGHDTSRGEQMYATRADGWKRRDNASWREPGWEQTEEHPVVGVSWEEANQFCEWLTARERRAGRIPERLRYRLPTDLEWSAAAGLANEPGATARDRDDKVRGVYPWGTEWPPPPGAGNFAGEEARVGREPEDFPVLAGRRDAFPRTAPVGSFAPNALGLHDLAGNVWEWCADPYPTLVGISRVIRGGSWANADAARLQTSCRGYDTPGHRGDRIGFRPVLAEDSPR